MSVSLEKLQRLRRQAGHGSGVSPSAPLPPAHDPLPALRRMLGIRERSQPSVPARACDRALPGDEIAPGLLRLEQVLAFDGVATQVDGTFARTGVLPTANMLFFDTETTGLSGGTGTRAFMVGASDFVPGGLRVLTETVPGVRSVSLGIWVTVGSRDESPEQAGAAHYLEHRLF